MTMRITAALALLAFGGFASADPLVVDGLQGLGTVHTHKMTSEATGSDYHIFVGLPQGYDASSRKTYPTLYILDGGAMFPIFSGYSRLLAFDGEIPEMILVAISYGTDDFREGNARSTDYTGPTDEREYWGGAPQFQQFLADDLVPLIEENYRSRDDRRMIFGRSIGGQFVLYTAQTRPDLFWGHIASNPALHRNLDFFLELSPDEASRARSKLFVSSGSEDDRQYRVPALAWMEHWEAVTDKPWALRTVTLEGHTHFSTPAIAFRQGITWLFN